MPANELVIAKAIVEVGATGVPAAKSEIATLQTELAKVDHEYQTGKISISEYAKQTEALSSDIKELTKGIQIAEAALKKYGSTGAAVAAIEKQIEGSTRNTGMAFLELSRAFEDAQYGLRGVLNNIPTTIQMFGGPAGLAAGVSAAAVAFSILQPYVTKLLKEFGFLESETAKATDAIGKLEERIKELEDQPVKLTVDQVELEQAKEKLSQLRKDQEAFNALKEGKTVFEKEAGDQFRQEFEEAGQAGVKAKDAVRSQILQEKNANAPSIVGLQAAQAAVREAESQLTTAFDAASRRMAQTQVDIAKARLAPLEKASEVRLANAKDAERETGALFSGAFAGNDKAKRDALIKRLRAAGQGPLASSLALSTPEEMERQSDIESAFDHSAAGVADRFARGRKAEKERLQKAEKAGRDADQNPEYQKDLAENDKKFGGIGREGVTLDEAVANVKAARKKDEARLKPSKPDDFLSDEQREKNRRQFAEEQLAKQIYQGSEQATGVQFTPDQARAAAKATGDMVSKNVNFNAALQSALMEQVQAMAAMGNQLMQQQGMMQQIGMEFQMVRRGIQTRQRTAGKRGG